MPPDEVLQLYAVSFPAYGLVFVLGTLFGSFANVCIYRMPPTEENPRGRSVVHPGSHCGDCGQPVRWYDNIPLLSYLVLRGRCRDCGAEFSPRYLFVEAALGMLFVATYHLIVVIPDSLGEPLSIRMTRFMVMAAFELVLVVIAFIDLDHKLILDKITYPTIPVFYGLGLLLPERGWRDGLIGAAVGYLCVRLIADGYYFLTRREGMGYGDGKLLALVGALLGWQAVVISLFFGSIAGSIIGITVLVVARRGGSEVLPGGEGERDETTLEGLESAGGDGPEDRPLSDDDPPPLRHTELPFGPFLVMGAIFFIFAQSWLRFSFAVLWGTNTPNL